MYDDDETEVEETVAQEDKCPICGNEDLVWSAFEMQEGQRFYPVECLKCGFIGDQWYIMDFECFTDQNGNEVEGE